MFTIWCNYKIKTIHKVKVKMGIIKVKVIFANNGENKTVQLVICDSIRSTHCNPLFDLPLTLSHVVDSRANPIIEILSSIDLITPSFVAGALFIFR